LRMTRQKSKASSHLVCSLTLMQKCEHSAFSRCSILSMAEVTVCRVLNLPLPHCTRASPWLGTKRKVLSFLRLEGLIFWAPSNEKA
jgi:hypothetical protein